MILNILTVFALSLPLFWTIREVRAVLFWLYLWQLKDYHLGRFIDHFRTAKGKQIFFDPSLFTKAILLGAIFLVRFANYQLALPDPWGSTMFFALDILLLFLIGGLYSFEALKALIALRKKRFLLPTLTVKMLALEGMLLTLVFSFAAVSFPPFFSRAEGFIPRLLFADIATPFIVSVVVFLFQPVAILGRSLMIQKARKKREQFPSLKVIGITGSYGKTSTKEFLARMLSKKFNVLKTKEHQNSEVGISRCILQELNKNHEVFVCEMGAYNRGGIKLLCDIAKPHIGILTGINEQHMSTFGSQENIVRAKYELIESLPSNGIAFFNAKNTYCLEMYNKTSMRKILYGQEAAFHGQENILGAMAVAKELGVSDNDILVAFKEIGNTFPGSQVRKGKDGIIIIDATYSANPDGVIANLEYLNTFPGKKILVMPCLIELGQASKEVHCRIGKKIREVCDLAVITTEDRFQDLKKEAGEKIVYMEDSKDIAEKIQSFCREKDVVLLEGRVPSNLMKLLS